MYYVQIYIITICLNYVFNKIYKKTFCILFGKVKFLICLSVFWVLQMMIDNSLLNSGKQLLKLNIVWI